MHGYFALEQSERQSQARQMLLSSRGFASAFNTA